MRNFYNYLIKKTKNVEELIKSEPVETPVEASPPIPIQVGEIMRSTDKFKNIPEMPFNRAYKRDYIRRNNSTELIKKEEG